MSYTIYYRSLFVKTRNNKYLPIIEMGDNNVWELGNRRRARSWYNCGWLARGEKYLMTAEEIMQEVEKMVQSVKDQYVGELKDSWDKTCTERWTEKDVEDRFGYFEAMCISGHSTNNTTAQQVRNFFRRGIERAMPIENVGLNVHWCTKQSNYERRYTNSEEELLAAIKEGKDAGYLPWVTFSSPCEAERILASQTAEKRTEQRSKTKVRTKGYVVTIYGDYINKATPRRFHYSPYLNSAYIYASRSSAEKLQQRIQRNNYPSEVYEVHKNEDGRWERVA